MAKPVWNLISPSYSAVLQDVMKNGGFVGTMTATHFTLGHGTNKMVFDGHFTLNAGVIVSGTITGFHIYADGSQAASASQYSITFAALADAIEAYRDMDNSGPLSGLVAAHGLVLNDVGGVNFLGGTIFGDVLRGNGGNDHMEGINGADILYGGAGKDSLYGGDGADTLYGQSGADTLDGGLAKDKLIGGAGGDFLDGGGARDVLTGGAGKDTFAFTGEFIASRAADRITDFVQGVDRIGIDGPAAAIPPGPLSSTAFFAGSAAHDADDRLIYDRAKGALYYDPDGKGGLAQIKLATLDGHPHLNVHDFIILT